MAKDQPFNLYAEIAAFLAACFLVVATGQTQSMSLSENPVVGPRASGFVTGKDGEAGNIAVYRRCPPPAETPTGRKTSRSKPDRVLRQAHRAVPFDEPSIWAREAVWYQIFVERFRNGDPANDPQPEFMRGAYPGYVPDNWKVTPWNQDWYEQQDWAKADGGGFYKMVQARRFGGDLQGVLEKLDYLQDLGVTAINDVAAPVHLRQCAAHLERR